MARAVFLSLCLLSIIAGCDRPKPTPRTTPQQAAAEPPVKPAPPTPLAEKKEQLGSETTWDPQWDAFIEKSLPPGLLSPHAARAVQAFCPQFSHAPEADQRAFWAYTFQALSAAEAGLKPTTDVHHTAPAVNRTDAVSHRPIRQEGLLQLTYQDAQRYNCDFDWAHDRSLPEKDPTRSILQPERNLACGLRIMDNQINTQGHPLTTRASYWSTLHPGTISYRHFAKQMANVPEACGLHTPTRHAQNNRIQNRHS